ncbi:MAG: hypothetical protein ACLTMP_01145 [Eggerthella lenta]
MFTIFMTLSLPTAYYYARLSGADTQGLTITLTCRRLHRLLFLAGLLVQRPHPQKAGLSLQLTGFVTSAGMLFARGWFSNWFP